jgi:hypothetical protein
MKLTAIVLVCIALLTVTNLFAQAPLLINYQGKLFDQEGNPLSATTNITFKIFSEESGGTVIWTETHQNVPVNNGLFTVMLGSIMPFTLEGFKEEGDRFLEISVGDETLQPRFRIASVAYAIRAVVADGVQNGSIDSNALSDGAVTQSKLAENITAIPVGSAGGDLSGVYPNPIVINIRGNAVSEAAPADKQVLKWNSANSQWEPAVDVSGGDGTVNTTIRLTGDGSSANPLDIAQQGATNNQVLTWNGTVWKPATINVSGGNTLDQAYDQGGAGVGRTITADKGAVNIAGTDGLTVSGNVSATTFSGNGSSLTGLNASNISSGTVPSSNLDADLQDLADGSLTGSKVGTGINAANITTGTISDNRLETSIDRSLLTASSGIGIGLTNPNSLYSLHIESTEKTVGAYIYLNRTTSGSNYGIWSDVNNAYTGDAYTYGIYSKINKASGTYPIYGMYSNVDGTSTGNKYAYYGRVVNNDNTGVIYGHYGSVSGTGTGNKYGVYGYVSGAGATYGVYGEANGSGGLSHGVEGVNGTRYGYLGGVTRGMEAYYDGSHWAYFASSSYAGYFVGNVYVNGTLSKAAGSFKIDHPLDPENKYLSHSFVESPDMKNIYDGVVELDNNGEATVNLPEWFGALNISYRYQLTAIGAPGPNLYISKEISNNQFSIAGGTAGMKVSWQVTGIRNDAYAQKYPIIVEEDKPQDLKGKYLNPSAYNLPEQLNEQSYQKPESIPQPANEEE